jgi:hypothetical protein
LVGIGHIQDIEGFTTSTTLILDLVDLK